MSELSKASGGKGGLGSSKGIGASKGLGGSGSAPLRLERRDPETFGPASLREETNANWQRASLALTADLAESWFGETQVATTVKERLKVLGLPDSFSEIDDFFLAEKLPDGFVLDVKSLGDLQPLMESPLAQKVMSYLNGRGVVALEHGLLQLSSNTFVNMNDLDGSTGANTSLESGGLGSNTWMGPWGSGFGSRFLQNFRVFKNHEGVETGVWFANAVFGTRAPARDGNGDLDAHEVFRREILIPSLAKRLFYLAETPLPSSIGTLGRNLAFNELDEKLWPQPFCSVNDFELTVCTIENPSGNPESNFHIFPQVVNFGWTFTATESHELEVLVPSVIDALTVVISILEDGFRNYPTLESSFSWADFAGSFDDELQGSDRAGTARWIPATQVGALVRVSNQLNASGHRESDERDFKWVAENGAGASVASCINSLVYSYLLPSSQLDAARRYLEIAISLDHFNESTNAMTNLAQVHLAAGDDELAEATLIAALNRADRYSEGEASLLLGHIYSKKNDSKKAKKFYERAAKSGHEEFAPAASSIINGETSNQEGAEMGATKTESKNRPQFCVHCGIPFGATSQNFCGGCGSPR